MLASLAKLMARRETQVAWERHHVLPRRYVEVVLPAVAALEMAVGIALLVRATTTAAAWAAASMFVLYSIYLHVALRSGLSTGCACFGFDRSASITHVHIARAASFALVAVIAAVAGERSEDAAAYAVGGMLGLSALVVSSILIMVADTLAQKPQEAAENA